MLPSNNVLTCLRRAITATGTLTVADVDTGENKFNTTVTSANGNLGSLTITDAGAYTYSVDNSLVQSLGAGQTKSETFTVKSFDDTASQDIKEIPSPYRI
jgi:VCBS repeat-containing protein